MSILSTIFSYTSTALRISLARTRLPLIYFAADVPVSGYDGDRDEFVGTYRSEENPIGLEQGCTGSTLAGGDPCFAFETDIELKAGEERRICFFLGAAMDDDAIRTSVAHCRESSFVDESFAELSERWNDYLGHFSCSVPDENSQRMINIWNPYQAERNFQFSRNLSYYATGTFRGVGFRDTAQDVLSVDPLRYCSLAREDLSAAHTAVRRRSCKSLFLPDRGL